MIGLSRLKRAIEDVPTGGMQTGDLKVRLKLCDAQRLEVEFNAIIAERDNALAQNAELVAQVVDLKSACQLAIDMFKVNDINVPNTIETLEDVVNATPAQCLSDIQAEAGRAGFMACCAWIDSDEVKRTYSDEQAANQYAERVKAGEV